MRLSTPQLMQEVAKVKRGDGAAFDKIVKHFEKDIRAISRSLFIMGADRSDVEQIARIGLWDAILEFDPRKGSLSNFGFKVCVRRQIITEINWAKKRRMEPLNERISLETPVISDGTVCQELVDSIADDEECFESRLIDEHEYAHLERELLKELTELEKSSYLHYKNGATYREIALALQQTEKTVDNALMRVRHKAKGVLRKYLLQALEIGEDVETLQTFACAWNCEDVLDELLEDYGAD